MSAERSTPKTPRRCLGWDEMEGKCENPAGSPTSPLWCMECEPKRLAYLDCQFQLISEKLGLDAV